MKRILVKTIFIFFSFTCCAQHTFRLVSGVGNQGVIINSRHYSIDSLETKITTHYPKFDTLTFEYEWEEVGTPIICNFKPDTSYSIIGACCGSLDIIPTSRFNNDSLNYWNSETDFEKIKNQLMGKPFISIRTKKHPKDSIYAWHADASCRTEHKRINTKLWRLGVPPKCFYWSNITAIQFFKQDNKLPKHERKDLEEFLEMDNIVDLSTIEFLLFDNERFVLIYDEKKNTIKLEYE